MAQHPAIAPGRVAVVTGAASGIGLAAAKAFARAGMRVCLADLPGDALDEAAAAVGAEASEGVGAVCALSTDVSDRAAVEALLAAASALGDIGVVHANAGIEASGRLFSEPERWRRILDVNLFGVVNAIQVFAPGLIERGLPAAFVATGSKQGITTPPGNTPYNVSKAGVRVATEALAHEFRQHPGSPATAHLLIPGFVYTGLTRARGVAEKPDAAWTPEQTVAMLLEGMGRGDFYILCPDNDVTRAMDEKRIVWAAGDIVENRPALSRWHPDFADAFKRHMED